MSRDLPAGYTWRRPTAGDAQDIWTFVGARNTAVLGFADCTLDDVVDELAEPDFDGALDGWLVHDPHGAVAGYGWACRNGNSDEIAVDATGNDDHIGGWLWAVVIERSREIAVELGHAEVKLDVGAYRVDEVQSQRVRSLGFAPGTTFHRMRIDHDGPRSEPQLPSGVTIRTGETDEAVRRDAHDVLNAATAGQFGFVPRPYEDWHEMVDGSSSKDWSQLRVADVDGRPAAMLLGNNQFVPDESCGYIARVAVIEEARGKGLAKLLIRQKFAIDSGKGRAGTILHVDTNNPTPALGLYESVGMRPVLVIDMWRRVLGARDQVAGASSVIS